MNVDSNHKNVHYYLQAGFSFTGLAFSATMLFVGKDPSVYLPLFTSILFAWLPSPISSMYNQQRQIVGSIPLRIGNIKTKNRSSVKSPTIETNKKNEENVLLLANALNSTGGKYIIGDINESMV